MTSGKAMTHVVLLKQHLAQILSASRECFMFCAECSPFDRGMDARQ